mmetsp:Transcript_2360/g.3427  ORF Transcript_2360/g.3427 Transcript_2360/m.3427 type:complete len:168 (+) Transcript_2360:168-671(+)
MKRHTSRTFLSLTNGIKSNNQLYAFRTTMPKSYPAPKMEGSNKFLKYRVFEKPNNLNPIKRPVDPTPPKVPEDLFLLDEHMKQFESVRQTNDWEGAFNIFHNIQRDIGKEGMPKQLNMVTMNWFIQFFIYCNRPNEALEVWRVTKFPRNNQDLGMIMQAFHRDRIKN